MAGGRIGTEIIGPDAERFRIETRLGNGSFGEVYKAVGTRTGAVAAVKMVPQPKLSDPSTLSVRTVLNEGRVAMLQVNHPNVVRILHVDSGSDRDIGPYLMMEYVSGGTLKDLLDQRRAASKLFTIEEAIALMREIALGAQAINEHLIHRDIKPDNILLDGPANLPRPRIADFGIAKVAADPTRPETFKGIQAVWYMAPEVWRGERNTPKIDVYSVGLVFYEILTLEHPLLAHLVDPADWVRWREVHLTIPCPDIRSARPEIPLSLAKLLLRMTDKSPGNRPDWDEVLSGLSLRTTQPRAPVTIDPQLLAALRSQADERFREEHQRTKTELARVREGEQNESRREEYKQSARRLLARFDEVIETLNHHESTYPIQIEGDGVLSRTYKLTNGYDLQCRMFGYLARPIRQPGSQILGGGYMGITEALTANLLLTGQPDDIASANWSAIEANVHALIHGEKRLKLYREARLREQTIRFLEFEDGGKPWRRDTPTYFGFEHPEQFFKEYEAGVRATHDYSFRMEPDVMRTFNQILLLGMRMPRKD